VGRTKQEKLENYALLNDQEIIESVKNKDMKTVDDNNDDDDDENPTMNAPSMPTSTEIIDMLEKIIYYKEAQENTTPLELSMLNSLLRKTALDRQSRVKQLDIRAFFK
jgi:hypothetical protein